MRHISRILFGSLLLAGAAQQVSAFSLIGAFDTWMTQEVGYQLGADLGGPMNLGEEYRWNIPVITYGFDESFLNYFGARGVEEIEKAIKILNDLPRFSQMSPTLSEYPLDTRRFNHRASALFLYDLKSYALSILLEQLGVAPAERYVWTLRSRVLVNNIPVYAVIQRNFDPVTFEPSSYVNGGLYTYYIIPSPIWNITYWEAVEFDVDPSLPSVTSVAALSDARGAYWGTGWFVNNEPGLFVTGLTRDDVGSLRYLYRPENVNVETSPTNAVLAASGSTALSGGSGGSPWEPPVGLTNILGGTNVLTVVSNAPVVQALRPGMDSITFERVDFDSLTGAWIVLTNTYVDSYMTNGAIQSQTLERVLPQPDILFSAADLGIDPDGFPYVWSRSISFVNQDAINGLTTLAGPGQIAPPLTITFSKLGDYLINVPEGGQPDGQQGFWWGSYDGTTNEPALYPVGASIKALERLVLTGEIAERASPWDPIPGAGGTGTGTGTGTGGTVGGGGGGGGGG